MLDKTYFSKKIKELRIIKKLTAAEIEKVLGLSGGSWSRYERSMTVPSLFIAYKISDFFGVSLDELVGKNGHKWQITSVRLKQAEQRLGQEEFEKAWLIGKKVWNLVSVADDAKRKENIRIIEAIANLLHEIETRMDEEHPVTARLSKSP